LVAVIGNDASVFAEALFGGEHYHAGRFRHTVDAGDVLALRSTLRCRRFVSIGGVADRIVEGLDTFCCRFCLLEG
jgi:hypothetical protein